MFLASIDLHSAMASNDSPVLFQQMPETENCFGTRFDALGSMCGGAAVEAFCYSERRPTTGPSQETANHHTDTTKGAQGQNDNEEKVNRFLTRLDLLLDKRCM
jgi:hypothetical protein